MTLVKVLIMLILFINLIIQAFKMVKKLHDQSYDPNARHQFQCKKCTAIYELSGEQLKELRWKPRVEVKTPTRQSSGIRFRCPQCHEKATQIIQYDYNETKGLGLFRLQMNENQKEPLLHFLKIGVLPLVVIGILLQIVQGLVLGIMNIFS